VVALALIAFGIYRQDNPALTMRGMQTALLAEEAQLKSELDRKLEAVRVRMSNWNPQRRATFEQNLNRIETALQQCRQLLQANPNDQAQHSAMLNLYQEKRQLLESVEQSK
jgi:hypothetical protein